MGASEKKPSISRENIARTGTPCCLSQRYLHPLMKLFYPTQGNFIAVVGKLNQPMVVRRTPRLLYALASPSTERLPWGAPTGPGRKNRLAHLRHHLCLRSAWNASS
jgi:hypothetical protein